MDPINIIFFILVVLYLFFRFFQNWRPSPWPTNHFKPPQWQVHRGYWVEGCRENSLEAFREARRRGFEMVELDVQLSKDLIPVVFHDSDLKRFGNEAAKVSDLTAAELKEKVQAPTLEEVLQDSQCGPLFNIEIKCKSIKDQRVAQEVAQCVKKNLAVGKVIFSSFNPISLWVLARELPEVPRALLATDDKEDPENALYLRKLWLGGLCKAHMVNLDKKMVTPQMLKRLGERKIPFAVWTVNDMEAARVFVNQGAISIISDRPSSQSLTAPQS